MQVFEFHFNPRVKKDLIFDSFCHEPENVYEKRLGSLFMAGILNNALPQHIQFLQNIARIIKEKYYRSASASSEKALKESLRKANEYLEKIAKNGDVSWLGNLGFCALSVKANSINQKNWEVNYTKVGELKIFLLRKGQIVDIDQKVKFDEIEPYPLKIFGNIVSGKLVESDILLILDSETLDLFLKENYLKEIGQFSLLGPNSERPKKIKSFFNGKRENLAQVFGLCLLIVLTNETLTKQKETIALSVNLGRFSFKKLFGPVVKLFKAPKLNFNLKSLIDYKKLIKFSLPKFKLPKLEMKNNQQAFLIILLIFCVLVGYTIFNRQEQGKLQLYQKQFEEIRGKMEQADNYLTIIDVNPQAKKSANKILNEMWKSIIELEKFEADFTPELANDLSGLKEKVSLSLKQLNQLVEIEEPDLFFEFKVKEFIPQKMVYFNDKLYFFSPFANNLIEINQEKELKILTTDRQINFATPLSSHLLLFSVPDQLLGIKNGQLDKSFKIDDSLGSNFSDLANYRSNLYCLDKENRIIKYNYLGDFQWDNPLVWLENEKAIDYKSIAVDSSVWLISKDNTLDNYYTGKLQKNISINIFPEPEDFSKIYTDIQTPNLYLLEPIQKRIVITDKSGNVIKQFQSQKFDSLLDLSVSSDAKTIWLLNGLKVYQINL